MSEQSKIEFTVFSIEEKKRPKKRKFSLVSIEDFSLSETKYRVSSEQFDLSAYSPYSYDYEKNEFWFVDVGKEAASKPFFYVAQYDSASKVVKVPLEDLKKILEERSLWSAAQPVFVFSIGRCGSTLFSKMSNDCGFFDYSEPDVLTKMMGRAKSPANSDAFKAAVFSLIFLSGVESSRVVIKLRSGSSKMANYCHKQFPGSRIIFLRRSVLDWAKSFILKFKWNEDQLINTLEKYHQGKAALIKNQIPFVELSYPDFVESEHLVYSALTGKKDVPQGILTLLDKRKSINSQEGVVPGFKDGEEFADKLSKFEKMFDNLDEEIKSGFKK